VILWCMMCEKCCIVENINLGEKVPSKSLYIYISIYPLVNSHITMENYHF
jgi:hypothetical protein